MQINNSPIISIAELNQILALDNKQDTNIEIQFKKPIQKIDIAFIAGLILFHRQHKTKFSINYPNGFDRIFEMRHYLMQFEKVFAQTSTTVFTYFKGISNITDNDYVASESFAPIILVNKDSIDNFFRIATSKTTGELSQLCEKYTAKVNQGNNETETTYLNSEKSITRQLTNYPPICTFVFTILYNKIAPFVKSKEKGIKKPIERTEELLAFTKEYAKGLHELAKNIVEHSSTGEGLVTIRAYDKMEQGAEDNDKILETHVFDFGENGIIQKLIEDTEKKKSQHRIYEEDLTILNGSFDLKDFIKPTVTKKLNQQLYRDLAHYGLMKFYKLIEKNEGVVISSSTKRNGDRDYYPIKDNKAIDIGTSYFFQLPFKPELFKSTGYVSRQDSLQGSSQTISGLSELMNLKVLKDIDENTDYEKNILFDFKSTSITIRNREDETTFFKLFTDLKERKIKYLAVNMKDVELSASSLLRFCAHLSTNYSQSIILYNLDFELYDEMLEDNKQFYDTLKDLENGIPYWYENRSVLVFSKLKDSDFSFADVLFGKNEMEFETANHIISHTFPNTLSIVKEISKDENFEIPDCLKPFFYQSSLLPIDLLLIQEEDKTLFQSNLEILLKTEINRTL